MVAYILKRLLLTIPTLLGVMLFAFTITQFVPGGPVEQLISELQGHDEINEAASGAQGFYQGAQGLDEERIAELSQLYGFDKPVHERFLLMLTQYLTLDFGDSYFQHKSVVELIMEKLPVSLGLGGWTFLFTYLICIPLGIRKALYDGTPFDIATSTLLLIGYAIPGFVLAILLLVLFGGGSFLDIFPLRGLFSDNWRLMPWWQQVLDYGWHLVLPIVSLMVSNLAIMTMLTKNSFIEEIRKQYVITAYAKGLSTRAVLYGHVFRNAVLPLVAGFPTAFVTAFLGGSLLIETVFSLDGLGLLSYNSAMNRDYPVVLGTLYIFALFSLLMRLLADVCYVLIDPRIRFGAIE